MFGKILDKPKFQISEILHFFQHIPQFKQCFMAKVGDGEFRKTECEQIPVPDLEQETQINEYDQQEFYMEGEDQVEAVQPLGINNFQFNSGMFAPSKKQTQNVSMIMPSFQLNQSLRNVYGYNSKFNSSIILINAQFLVFGAGSGLVVAQMAKNNKIGHYQIFQGHNHEITCIYYDQKQNLVFSGSTCLQNRAEIIKWNIGKDKNNSIKLLQSYKYYLPRKIKGVGWLVKANNILVCIDEFSLHNNSMIYLYDTDNTQSYRHINQAIKVNGKVIDFALTHENSCITLVTNCGIKKFENFMNKNPVQTVISQQKLTCICSYSLLTSQNEFFCGTSDGCLWESSTKQILDQIHSGWIVQLLFTSIKAKNYLISSGGDDKKVKIFVINQSFAKDIIDKNPISIPGSNIKKLNCLSLFEEIQLTNYSTALSLSLQKDNNLLVIGCRSGGIIVYSFDEKKIVLKHQMINNYENLPAKLQNFKEPIYNKLADRIFIPKSEQYSSKDNLFNTLRILKPQPEIDSPNYFISASLSLQFNCICFDIRQNSLIYVLSLKIIEEQEIFPIVIRSLSQLIQQNRQNKKKFQQKQAVSRKQSTSRSINNKSLSSFTARKNQEQEKWEKFQDQCQFGIQDNIKIINLKLNTQKYGKVCIVKHDTIKIMLGTSYGYFLLHDLQSDTTIISDQKHEFQIQDIAWQTNIQNKTGTDHIFYKSVSGSQLFYWFVEQFANEKKLIKIDNRTKHLQELKKAEWSHITKYSWQSKYIWQTLTHYDDLSCISVLNSEYALVSMADGNLRIYNYPIDKKNSGIFQVFKLFSSKFTVITCSNRYFCCTCKGVALTFQLAQV